MRPLTETPRRVCLMAMPTPRTGTPAAVSGRTNCGLSTLFTRRLWPKPPTITRPLISTGAPDLALTPASACSATCTRSAAIAASARLSRSASESVGVACAPARAASTKQALAVPTYRRIFLDAACASATVFTRSMFMTYLRKGTVGKLTGRISRAAAAMATLVVATEVTPGRIGAQGTAPVSGQVTILERPGETSEDLGNVVVFLESAVASPRVRGLAATNTAITLQSRQFSPRVRVVTQGSAVGFRN